MGPMPRCWQASAPRSRRTAYSRLRSASTSAAAHAGSLALQLTYILRSQRGWLRPGVQMICVCSNARPWQFWRLHDLGQGMGMKCNPLVCNILGTGKCCAGITKTHP